ncbi:uncharacterized protein BT62DRAFT_931523 [Guyanagaster necrorhizus]|uniref:Uncharacterized protein n=1 Tax=Guyanagaster necrorhizus TaxID=856835 RepID=A0A9P7VUN5_9AGAR|nr:uncharacterized protein BT62DRAFT_931523 [Guyanagaster necrorhizus MCA 3950]KAG7446948.1 hypothetical protein BT62DRAFT_931523 [Guyanagaster necrorhizus MCA 3950]
MSPASWAHRLVVKVSSSKHILKAVLDHTRTSSQSVHLLRHSSKLTEDGSLEEPCVHSHCHVSYPPLGSCHN